MRGVLLSGLSALILAGAMALSAWRWLLPRRRTLDVQGIGLLALMMLTLVGGFIGGFFWWTARRETFSWELPPLASRMLAAAAWSFVVPTFMALEHPSRRRLRLALIILATYLLPLLIAIVLFHLDRFDPGAAITYSFFIIVIAMSVSSVWYLFRQPSIIPSDPSEAVPSSPLVQAWLGLITIVTTLWGVALFVTDDGPSTLIWVWPGDLLTSRLIGVMLLTIAAGAAYAMRYADTARVMLGVTLVYGVGVALASLWNRFGDKPVKGAYVVVFGAMFLGSLALLAVDRVGRPLVSRATEA